MLISPLALPQKLLVIAGSAKAGTTALARYLGDQDGFVAGREKEPKYFTRFSERQWCGPGVEGFIRSTISSAADYAGNFPGLASNLWAIDASTDYLWCPDTIELLAGYARHAEVKVICIIRDPLDRAVSEYNHTLRHGWEEETFAASLDIEEARIQAGWHPLFYHARRSTVQRDLRQFHDAFGGNLLVIDYAQLSEPVAVLGRIAEFTGFPVAKQDKLPMENQTFLPRGEWAKLIIKSCSANPVVRQIVPANIRARVWDLLNTSSRIVKTVRPAELLKLRGILAEEIQACIRDPLVPTDGWQAALPD